MDTILIDTDVCIDFLTARMPWYGEAIQIFEACEEGRISGYVSGLSYSNLFYILRKDNAFQSTVSMLSDLRKISKVSPISTHTVDWSLSKQWTDFEDAMQYQSAVESGCRAVVTRNLHDYRMASSLPVLSPADFISKYMPPEPEG